GGDGFRYIGNATEDNSLIISNGTFQGAAGGTVSGIAGSATANGGNGLYAEEATVEIHGGDFSGSAAGTANGIEGVTGVGLRTSNSTVTVHGGAFDAAEFSGTSTLSLQGGDFAGDVVFTDGITADLSLGSSMNVAGEMVQFGGAVNVDAWSAQHFQNTVIYGGTMNFSGQGFNLVDGSSFKLLDTGSTVNFNGGFTAESGSEITTVFDGTTPSAITGTDLVFEEGVKWTIHGVSTTANGDTITMASATSSLSNNIDSADVEYIGASWAAVLTVTNEANNLVGIYGYASLEDSLGLDPEDGGFGTTMAQLSEFTDFENSGDGDYVALKNLPTQEAATVALKGQFDDNAMVGALIQMQGLFADQIKNRTRSYRYYKNGGGAVSYSPQGAQGPDAWNKGMDSLNDSLPSWDARGTMRNLDDSLPNWDSTGSHEAPAKKVSTNQPKSKRNKIKVPSTWQTWGRGYGSYFNQDETADLVGYDATVGGGVLGVDKRLDHLLLGLGGGYAHTYMNGNGGGEDEVATFYGTAYAAMSGGKGFLEFNANYAFNDVETEGSAAAGDYLGDYNASTLGMYLGGGMDFPIFKDSLLLTPEASMLATYYVRDSYTETSSSVDDWPDMTWDDYDQMSYLGSLGATLSMIKQIEAFNLEMGFHPEVRAHYLHEFNADMDADSYLMEGYADPIGVVLQAREEDLLKLGTGVRFSKWNSDTLEFGLDLDVLFGQDYEAYIGSVKLLHRF
ncbi:MAG: autotransporter outer membrane beta-barrel domain-containing protein, partial [Verrucomicrobia bacterium]|nr:autotransporter outer membrane beta-barrel domain-containing protein [Verrucomicrobiota bacterium]